MTSVSQMITTPFQYPVVGIQLLTIVCWSFTVRKLECSKQAFA